MSLSSEQGFKIGHHSDYIDIIPEYNNRNQKLMLAIE